MGALRAGLVAVVLLALGAADAQAHGTVTTPASRAYVCRYLDRDSAPCANAWATRPQAMYDWMGILISKADGRHRQLIDDGELCSAGNPEDFGVYDRAGADWLATGLTPGRQTFTWTLNAPHATRYYRFFITKPGYDPAEPLRWDDLELFHDSGPRGAAKRERFDVTVPERTGRHVVYSIWQRSDSPEAFYSCSDVVFGERGQVPRTPPAPDESLNQPGGGDGMMPGHPGHGDGGMAKPGKATRKGIRFSRKVDTDWGDGYCATITVTNRSKKTRTWKGSLRMRGTVTGLWNAKHHVRKGRLHVRGEAYNATLRPRATTTFGFCATRR